MRLWKDIKDLPRDESGWITITENDMVVFRVRIGYDAQIGDFSQIGDNTKCKTNPVQIQGSRHLITHHSPGHLAIGCMVEPIPEWLADYKIIGEAEGYTGEQIEEYGNHIRYMAEVDKWFKWETE